MFTLKTSGSSFGYKLISLFLTTFEKSRNINELIGILDTDSAQLNDEAPGIVLH